MKNNIIFAGPVRSGKTTAIKTISDDSSLKINNKFNLDFEYGVLNLDYGVQIYLTEVPSKDPHSFVGSNLVKGGLGLVLLLDNSRSSPIDDMNFFIYCFSDFIARTSLAIGVINMDENEKPDIREYHHNLHETKLKPAVFSVDAYNKKDVTLLVKSLLYSLEPGAEA